MTDTISRRNMLVGASAVTAALATGVGNAADKAGHRHEDHAPAHPDVVNAADACSASGVRCLSHCLVSFQEGDTTLATCARKVNEMISLCDALSAQAAGNSPYVDDLAKVCRTACADCEKECRKHEDDHIECKDCADACVAIVAAIDAM